MPTYKDAEVIKALCGFEAKDGDIAHLHQFIVNTFPEIPEAQLSRCMNVAFPGQPSDPTIDAAATKLANEALRKSGHNNLIEFLQEGSEEANELLEKLKTLGEGDTSKKLGN